MRYGVCAGVGQVQAIADAGFDYVELTVTGVLAPESDEATWATTRKQLLALPLRPEAFSVFVPGHRKIVGPDADPYALGRYAFSAIERASQVGGQVIVLGSGAARSIPDGYPPEAAYRELRRFLHQCADAAERFGVCIAIEPLGVECPFIASVDEGAALAREIARPGAVGTLADTWHMDAIAEPLEAILRSADVLVHAHTAGPGRDAPCETHDFAPLHRTLRAAGYEGRLSLEVRWESLEAQAPDALSALKRGAAA